MIEEKRNDCFEYIVNDLTRTSEFRARKFKQYPDDSRNLRASESLKLLAKNATGIPDEYWENLQPLYDPDSKVWRDALCRATKDIGFSNKSNNFNFFLRNLISLLPQSQAVA
jgi:hypothetical protein